jgi:2-haloacid dehalogenase
MDTQTSDHPLTMFDVNETLLDLDTLVPTFAAIFGDPGAMQLWSANLIMYSEALTLSGVYVPLTDIGSAVLKMLANTQGVTVSDETSAELTQRFASMPLHPEVPGTLRRLRDHGFRLFTLTDNRLDISTRKLERGGIIDLFERRFSVDQSVQAHKPTQAAYRWLAGELGVGPERLCLIACHVWDTIGALAGGWEAAVILRSGNASLSVGPQPSYAVTFGVLVSAVRVMSKPRRRS